MRALFWLVGISAALAARAEVRIRENWNAGWLFARQSHGTGELGSFDRENRVAGRIEAAFRRAPEPAYDDSGWQPVTLPHTWNAHDVMDQKPGYWRGIGWYRKHFRIERKYAGQAHFCGVRGRRPGGRILAQWPPLGIHAGGYTGFEFDLTGGLRFGEEENVLTGESGQPLSRHGSTHGQDRLQLLWRDLPRRVAAHFRAGLPGAMCIGPRRK